MMNTLSSYKCIRAYTIDGGIITGVIKYRDDKVMVLERPSLLGLPKRYLIKVASIIRFESIPASTLFATDRG